MKLQKIADSSLREMVKAYAESGKDLFPFSFFQHLFPGEPDDTISKSLYLLRDDGLISVSPGSDLPYYVSLSASAIRSCQEDTLLKKGYSFIKEVKSLIG